ncbi:hypothetical protein C8R45DRAFT_935854 [Mycena sanguinolenta]|nr:hypothetical protein C8R45DRAFT_935854 [Mycena sanguinolenta]
MACQANKMACQGDKMACQGDKMACTAKSKPKPKQAIWRGCKPKTSLSSSLTVSASQMNKWSPRAEEEGLVGRKYEILKEQAQIWEHPFSRKLGAVGIDPDVFGPAELTDGQMWS